MGEFSKVGRFIESFVQLLESKKLGVVHTFQCFDPQRSCSRRCRCSARTLPRGESSKSLAHSERRCGACAWTRWRKIDATQIVLSSFSNASSVSSSSFSSSSMRCKYLGALCQCSAATPARNDSSARVNIGPELWTGQCCQGLFQQTVSLLLLEGFRTAFVATLEGLSEFHVGSYPQRAAQLRRRH